MKKLIDILKKDKIKILKLIFSFIATAGIIGVYEINTNSVQFTNSFINIIIFFLYITIYYKLPNISKKEKIYSVIFSTFLSFILIIGTQLEFYSEIIWNILTILKIICLIFTILPFINYLLFIINNFKSKNSQEFNFKKLSIITFFIIGWNVFNNNNGIIPI